jgi:hypothetical protein
MTKASEVLLRALRSALRPIVKLMLAKGVVYTQFSELMKALYVDVAAREFALEGRPQTDSRISLLTGIHRKDIRRLRALSMSDLKMPDSVSLGLRVVSAWSEDPFIDADGNPLPLPRLARSGSGVSFDALVGSVSRDIRARALLDEWLNLGVVTLTDTEQVVLNTAAFIPSQGFDEKAFYLGHNLGDHGAAIASNLIGEARPFLERSVHYDSVPAGLVEQLGRDAEAGGMRLLRSINQKVIKSAEHGSGSEQDSSRRFTFGIYFYSETPVDRSTGVDEEREE